MSNSSSVRKPTALIAHVPYRHRGGEDQHVEILSSIYESLGYQVVFFPENRDPFSYTTSEIGRSLFRFRVPHDVSEVSLVHLHNIYPVLGPAFLRSLSSLKVPILWTVHNHRLYCTNGLALYEGKRCEICKNSPSVLRPIAKNCNSDRSKSIYYANAIGQVRSERMLDRVSIFIAPSPYLAQELREIGISAEKIALFPNPVIQEKDVNRRSPPFPGARPSIVYAGRLSHEKGVGLFPELARRLPEYDFEIYGDGPLFSPLRRMGEQFANLRFHGSMDRRVVFEALEKSAAGILPSICNEICPTFAIEALALGKPVYLHTTASTEWFVREFGAIGVGSSTAQAFGDAIRAHSPQKFDAVLKKKVQASFSISEYTEKLRSLLSRI